MQILDLAIKDIRQILRDWKSVLFLVIMPVLFTLFFGLVFDGIFSADSQEDERLPVGLIDQDGGELVSAGLASLLAESEVVRPVVLEGDEVSQSGDLVAEGELAAVIRIPAGYSQAILADQAASLEVIADQGDSTGRAALNALDTVTGRLMGAVESAHIAVEAAHDGLGFEEDASRQAYFEERFREAAGAWSQPMLSVKVEQATGEIKSANPELEINGYTQSSAGMIVQFAIFGLINSAMILVMERKTGALRRMLTTPVRRSQVIGGHILAMFLVVFTQETLLVLLGQYAFGVDYLRQPAAVLLMMVMLALWAASLGLLIGAVAKKDDQVIVLCLLAMFVFASMGGAWFPLEVTGKTFSTIGHFLPTAWAMDGFQNIILRGLGFSSVLLPASILLAYALGFFGLALWRFKFE